MVSNPDRRIVSVLLAVGGPALLGAAIGLPSGGSRMLTLSWRLPLVANGIAILMAPALYIAISLVQAAPPASEVAGAMGKSLKAYGTVLAGLAPAIAFLAATSYSPTSALLGGILAAGGAALAGLRALLLGLELTPTDRRRASLVFAAWACVTLALGGHLFVRALVA